MSELSISDSNLSFLRGCQEDFLDFFLGMLDFFETFSLGVS